jgi:Ca2+-dependent lipid-binding protein
MMIHFFAGLRNVIGVPIPVWVEAREAIGTLRTRLQIIQEPPFVKVLD